MLPLLSYNNRTIPVQLNRRKGIKRMTLRLSRTADEVVVRTHPTMPLLEIKKFILSSRAWIEAQLSQQQKVRQAFSPDRIVNLLGQPFHIDYQEKKRAQYKWEMGKIIVKCPQDRFDLILMTCLRDIASTHCNKWSAFYAKELGLSFNRLTIKDVKGRWGSCSSRRNLNYNWRLIFAPEAILKYVCAHEVAHLKHMNHSPEFWSLVATICPEYLQSRKWLKINGDSLYAFG